MTPAGQDERAPAGNGDAAPAGAIAAHQQGRASRVAPAGRASLLSRASEAAAILFVLSLIAWIGVQPYPALQDYPEWLYQGYVFHQMLQGDPAAWTSHALVPYPVPNSMVQAIFALAMVLADPIIVGKLVLALFIVLFFVLLRRIAQKVNPGQSGAMLLVSTLLFIGGPTFWSGNINFEFSMLALAFYGYRSLVVGRASPGLVLVAGIVIFFCHAIGFSVFVLLVVGQSVVRRRWACIAALVPALALLAVYSLASTGHPTAIDSDYYSNPLLMLMYKAYTVLKQGVFRHFILGDGTSFVEHLPTLYWAGVVANGIWAGILMVGLAVAAYRYLVGQATLDRFANFSVIALVGLIFLVTSPLFLEIYNLGERYLILALLLAFLILPIDRRAWSALASLAILVVPYYLAFFVVTARMEVWDYPWSVPESATLSARVAENFPNSHRILFAQRLYLFATRGHWLARERGEPLPRIEFLSGFLRPREP